MRAYARGVIGHQGFNRNSEVFLWLFGFFFVLSELTHIGVGGVNFFLFPLMMLFLVGFNFMDRAP